MTDSPALEAHVALVAADIKKHGIHILHVAEGGGLAPFSYSVGMNRSMKVPDLAVIGLKKDIAEAAIRRYRDGLLAKRSFRVGERVGDLFEGSEGELRRIHPSHFREWFGWNVALYGGTSFRMLQLVYPATDGSWPWEPQASAWFKGWQPLLETPSLHEEG